MVQNSGKKKKPACVLRVFPNRVFSDRSWELVLWSTMEPYAGQCIGISNTRDFPIEGKETFSALYNVVSTEFIDYVTADERNAMTIWNVLLSPCFEMHGRGVVTTRTFDWSEVSCIRCGHMREHNKLSRLCRACNRKIAETDRLIYTGAGDARFND